MAQSKKRRKLLFKCQTPRKFRRKKLFTKQKNSPAPGPTEWLCATHQCWDRRWRATLSTSDRTSTWSEYSWCGPGQQDSREFDAATSDPSCRRTPRSSRCRRSTYKAWPDRQWPCTSWRLPKSYSSVASDEPKRGGCFNHSSMNFKFVKTYFIIWELYNLKMRSSDVILALKFALS